MSLLTNLVGYWKLDEASGDAIDSHGNHDLAENNTPDSVEGKISGARSFDSSLLQGFSKGADSELGITDSGFTFACWVKPNGFGVIASKGWGVHRNFREEWRLSIGEASLVFRCRGTNSNPNIHVASLPLDEWSHVVCGREITSIDTMTLFIYVNGVLAPVILGSPFHNFNSAVGGRGFSLGFMSFTGTDYFDGAIDEAAYWMRTLTEENVSELYNSGNGLAYPFSTGNPTGNLNNTIRSMRHAL